MGRREAEVRECAAEEEVRLARGGELVLDELRACEEERGESVEEEASRTRMLLVPSLFMLSRCFSFDPVSQYNDKYIQCKTIFW